MMAVSVLGHGEKSEKASLARRRKGRCKSRDGGFICNKAGERETACVCCCVREQIKIWWTVIGAEG